MELSAAVVRVTSRLWLDSVSCGMVWHAWLGESVSCNLKKSDNKYIIIDNDNINI